MINAYNQYKQNAIATATPAELTLMLYEGLIRFIKQGEAYIEKRDIENAHHSIVRAQDIVEELNETLNMDYPISHNLRSLYFFIEEKLIEANIKKDIQVLRIVLEFAYELRDTWKEAMEIAKKPRIKPVE